MSIQKVGRFIVSWMGNDISTDHILVVQTDDIYSGPKTGIDFLQFVVMVLQSADATGLSTRQTDDFVANLKAAIQKRACYYGAKTC